MNTIESYPIQLNKLINTKQVVKVNPQTGVVRYLFPGTIYLAIPEGVTVRITLRIGFRQNDLSTNSFDKLVKAELLKGNTYDQLIEKMQAMKIKEEEEGWRSLDGQGGGR